MNVLQDAYNQVVDWNKKVGMKFHHYDSLDFWKALSLQADLLKEETNETVDATKGYDAVECLDGIVDVFVIMSYYLAQLEAAGFDVGAAIQKVLDNNSKKVYNSFYAASEAKDKLEDRDDVEYYIETSIVNGLPFYCVKRADGKVMKPVGFVAVDLSECVPT